MNTPNNENAAKLEAVRAYVAAAGGLNRAAAELAAQTRAAGDRLTETLRAELRRLAGGAARKRHGDAVAEALLRWAAEARIETLADFLDAKGWADLDAAPERAAKLEAAIVAAWQSCGDARAVTFIDNFFDLTGGRPPEEQADAATVARMAETPVKPAVAFLTIPRGEPLPADLPEGARAVAALDGLKALLARHNWIPVARGLVGPKGEAWLALLAAQWITDRAEAEADRVQRQAEAAELAAAPAVHVHARKYGRLPKVTAGLSWAFGGPGVELSRVTVDGRTYAPAPDLAIVPPSALVPAAYALLPADHAKHAHQTLLPIDLDGTEDAPPLPVALADATQYAIAPAAGKLGLLVMAAAHAGKGKLHKTTLRELTQAINPDARLVRTHFETVCRGLGQLDGLRLVLPNGMAYRVFECPVPWREVKPAEYDAPLFVGLTRTFERTLAAIQDAAGASYRGDFLFDLTGAMKLPTRRPGLVRQYIRAAAFWNAYWKPGTKGEPDPDRVPEVDAERWAALTNYLPPTAAEYLRAKGKGRGDRRSLSHSIKDALADAAALAESGLVKIARADRHAVRLLPPPEYLEAWHESRKGAHKLPGNAPED